MIEGTCHRAAAYIAVNTPSESTTPIPQFKKKKQTKQVRQRVEHKRTFFFLEQLILARRLHKRVIDVELVKDGMDLFFSDKASGPLLSSPIDATTPPLSHAFSCPPLPLPTHSPPRTPPPASSPSSGPSCRSAPRPPASWSARTGATTVRISYLMLCVCERVTDERREFP